MTSVLHYVRNQWGPTVLVSLGAHLRKFAICLEESMPNSTDL